jgi:hypothetical protein
MKKYIIILLLAIYCINAYSIEFYKNDLLKKQTNDFVVYWDKRNGNNSLYGIEYKGDDTYVIRSYDLVTKDEIILQASYHIDNMNRIISQVSKVIKGEDKFEVYKKPFIEFSQFLMIDNSLDRNKFPNDIYWYLDIGKDLEKLHKDIVCKFWIPLFNIYSIIENSNPENVIKLVDFGRPGNEESTRFYTLNSIPTVVKSPTYYIKQNTPRTIQYDMIQFNLDDNWKINSDSAKLANITNQDALISFKNMFFYKDKINGNDYSLLLGDLTMIMIQKPIVTESVSINIAKNYVIFDYYVLNTDDNMLTHVFDIFVYDDTSRVDNITIFSYASLYNDNREYFLKIVNMITQNGKKYNT